MELLKADVASLVANVQVIEETTAIIVADFAKDPRLKEQLARESPASWLRDPLKEIMEELGALGHHETANSIALTLTRFDHEKLNIGDFVAVIRGIGRVVSANLLHRKFLYVPTEQSVYYEKSVEELFDGALSKFCERFPSSVDELTEACRCFALDRNTACVFHCMRLMESTSYVVVKSLPRHKRKTGGTPGWGLNSRILSDFLENPKTMPKITDKRRAFYVEIRGDFQAAYKAFRCTTMHEMERTYTDRKAQTILNATTEYLKDLAKHLSQEGKFLP